MPDAFRKHLSDLMGHLVDSGIAALVEMEDAKQVTHDEKRSLQYMFVSGMRDAQFAMSDPKAAVKHSRGLQDERLVAATMESDICSAVEQWLEYVLGPKWRVTTNIGLLQFPPPMDELRKHLTKLRAVVLVKPSEVKERLISRGMRRGIARSRRADDGNP